MVDQPRVMIAGVRGGSGKTTLSLALITAFTLQKGLRVIPFKKGPDYIDAGWMSVAAGSPCYNLDPFLIPREKIVDSFVSHGTGDLALIEGNRGLYDGVDAEGAYSTAELAKLLRSPVVLIVDCTKMTRTTAAVVLGCIDFDRDVMIKGVVLNQVSGSRHEAVARASVEKYCSVPVLGAIPRFTSGEFPERHMGLTPHQEHPDTAHAIAFMERVARDFLDSDGILSIAQGAVPLGMKARDVENEPEPEKTVRIGVIRDSAFQFYYPENLEELRRRGADLVEMDAMKESDLPEIEALYIGGGFPETNALKLARNGAFRNALLEAAEQGLPIYAECGGLMFLGEALVVEGKKYPMVGIFPLIFEMKRKPVAHGYTVIEVENENPFYPVGLVLRGHEFHYSSVLSMSGGDGVHTAFRMRRGKGIHDSRDGICYRNVFATYTHIHALGAPAWAEGLIRKAKEFKYGR